MVDRFQEIKNKVSLQIIINYVLYVILVPTVAPENVKVYVQNWTLAEVSWDAVPLSTVQGRLNGYKVLT